MAQTEFFLLATQTQTLLPSKLSVPSHKAAPIEKKEKEDFHFSFVIPVLFLQNSSQTPLLYILKMGSEFCCRLYPFKGVLLYSCLYCVDASCCNSIKTQHYKFPRSHSICYRRKKYRLAGALNWGVCFWKRLAQMEKEMYLKAVTCGLVYER